MATAAIQTESPVKRAFDQLGGVTSTARAITMETGIYVTVTTASSWLVRDSIPTKYWYAFTQLTDISADEFTKYAFERAKDTE